MWICETSRKPSRVRIGRDITPGHAGPAGGQHQLASLIDLGPNRALDGASIVRHHRLLELYLAETLGIHVDDVHAEADRLEHVLSEELEARIDQALGYPTHDPHGDPIPTPDLKWPAAR